MTSRRSSCDQIQCPCAAAELIGFNTEVLEHRDKQITQGLIMIPAKGNVLTVSQAASTNQDGQVRVVMRVRVTHVASKQDHRAVEQTVFTFASYRELLKQLAEHHHLLMVGILKL